MSGTGADAIGFDVFAEPRFADRTGYDRFLARGTEPQIAHILADDQDKLSDRT